MFAELLKLNSSIYFREIERKSSISKIVYELAIEGNKKAETVFKKVGTALGIAIADLGSILNLDGVVIGGGVSNSWKFFYKSMMEEISLRLHPLPRKRLKVVRAKLGERAGIIGVAKLVFDRRQ